MDTLVLIGLLFTRLSSGLDDVIERIGVLPLKLANAIAELSECDAIEDFDDGIAHFLHDTANAAELFIRAGAAFVKFFADATDGCKRAFDEANDTRERDFIGRKFKAITAGNAAAAFENAGGAEVIEDLFEEALWDVLLLGDGLDANHLFVGVQPKDNKRAERVFTSER